MGTALLGSNHETNLNFSSHSKTVWVECPTGGVADLTFEARTTNGTVICSDKVHFYPFSSIITVFGGRTQVPNDPPDANEGVFLVALDLYTNGFDVHAYDEKTLATDGSGIAYTEVTNAIATRGVSSVGVFGYSYGGDATHDLSRRLDENRAKIEHLPLHIQHMLTQSRVPSGHFKQDPAGRSLPRKLLSDSRHPHGGQLILRGRIFQ